jgi:hypothetical protein
VLLVQIFHLLVPRGWDACSAPVPRLFLCLLGSCCICLLRRRVSLLPPHSALRGRPFSSIQSPRYQLLMWQASGRHINC